MKYDELMELIDQRLETDDITDEKFNFAKYAYTAIQLTLPPDRKVYIDLLAAIYSMKIDMREGGRLWLAQDKSGIWYVYSHEPIIKDAGHWDSRTSGAVMAHHIGEHALIIDRDWKESLVLITPPEGGYT
jgi:hypothetical protein